MQWRNDAKAEYIGKRVSTGRDDRCSESKLRSDAELRGKLGVAQANRIIDMVDDGKSRGHF